MSFGWNHLANLDQNIFVEELQVVDSLSTKSTKREHNFFWKYFHDFSYNHFYNHLTNLSQWNLLLKNCRWWINLIKLGLDPENQRFKTWEIDPEKGNYQRRVEKKSEKIVIQGSQPFSHFSILKQQTIKNCCWRIAGGGRTDSKSTILKGSFIYISVFNLNSYRKRIQKT